MEADAGQGWAIVRVEREQRGTAESCCAEAERFAQGVYARAIDEPATRRITGRVEIRRENG